MWSAFDLLSASFFESRDIHFWFDAIHESFTMSAYRLKGQTVAQL